MKINLKGTGLQITSEITSYLYKRLDGMEKFLPLEEDGSIVDVELGKTTRHHQTGDIFRAEINIHIGSQAFRAVSEKEDLFTAIDEMKSEIMRELGSSKDKKVSIVRRSGQKIKNLFRKFYR